MRNLNLLLCTLALFISANLLGQSSGLKTSYFSKDVVLSILNQQGCTGLRMYPVINTATNSAVVMIIGVNSAGSEIYNPSVSGGSYQIYSEVSYSTPLNQTNARASCDKYASNNKAFVSDISKSTVDALLAEGSDGIAISYTSGGQGNFGIQSFKNTNNPSAYGKMQPGNPCPSACGEPSQYLRSPQN